MKKIRLGKQASAQVPSSAGSRDSNYVAGFNPRKGDYSASLGTNPKVKAGVELPKPGSASAPFKHQAVGGGKFKFF